MLSESRLAANRANARLSTGPKTPEGKAVSSQNARKHGLTSRDLTVPPNDRPEFDQLQTSLYEDLQPEGALETELFRQIVRAAWNLRRIPRLETELIQLTHGTDPLANPDLEAEFARLGKYRLQAERSFYRALKALRELQTDRALRHRHDYKPQWTPPLTNIRELAKRTHFHDDDLIREIRLGVVSEPEVPLDSPPPPKNSPRRM